MERLTEFHNGIWGMSVQAVKDGYDKYSVFSKLAEYEDTGLIPKEITSMIVELSMRYKAYENLTEKNERLQKECVDTYNQMMDTEKDFQRIISESNKEITSLKEALDLSREEVQGLSKKLVELQGLNNETDKKYHTLVEMWGNVCDVNAKQREKLQAYNNAEKAGVFVKLPCKVGSTVYVDSRTIPTASMDFEEGAVPKYFEATVVSYRKNAKSKYIKLKVRAGWLHEWIDSECGPDSCYCDIEKYFTYPMSAIGITVFLTIDEAKEVLKEVNHARD